MKPEAHIPTDTYNQQHPVLANPGETHLMHHMPQLDGVRALAVLMVIWWHFMPRAIAQPGSAPWGAIGVGLFFALSGFLITRILLNCRQKIDDGKSSIGQMTKQFYMRRFLRIFPLYYGVLAVLFVLNVENVEQGARVVPGDEVIAVVDGQQIRAPVEEVQKDALVVLHDGQKQTLAADAVQGAVREFRDRIWWHVAYLSNVRFSYWPKGGEIERHLWSLSVEEQFYLIWPLLIFLVPRKWIAPLIMLTVLSAPLWRALTYTPRQFGHEWMMPGCLDLLGLGALLALFSLPKFGLARWFDHLVSFCGLVGVPLFIIYVTMASMAVQGKAGETLVVSQWTGWEQGTFNRLGNYTFRFEWPGGATYTVTALFAVWLIGMASRGFRGVLGYVLASSPMVYIGRISYGLYVLHMFVPHLVDHFFPNRTFAAGGTWAGLALYTAISIVMATASWYAFEAPINRLKKYFEYDGAKPAAAGLKV